MVTNTLSVAVSKSLNLSTSFPICQIEIITLNQLVEVMGVLIS